MCKSCTAVHADIKVHDCATVWGINVYNTVGRHFGLEVLDLPWEKLCAKRVLD